MSVQKAVNRIVSVCILAALAAGLAGCRTAGKVGFAIPPGGVGVMASDRNDWYVCRALDAPADGGVPPVECAQTLRFKD